MIDISYNKSENIIIGTRRGNTTVQDVISYIEKIDKDFNNQDELYVLEDYRNGISNYKTEDYPIIIGEIKKRVVHYKIVKNAVLVDSPSDTVLAILYEEISNQIDNYYFKVFSTVSAAKHWLKT